MLVRTVDCSVENGWGTCAGLEWGHNDSFSALEIASVCNLQFMLGTRRLVICHVPFV